MKVQGGSKVGKENKTLNQPQLLELQWSKKQTVFSLPGLANSLQIGSSCPALYSCEMREIIRTSEYYIRCLYFVVVMH